MPTSFITRKAEYVAFLDVLEISRHVSSCARRRCLIGEIVLPARVYFSYAAVDSIAHFMSAYLRCTKASNDVFVSNSSVACL